MQDILSQTSSYLRHTNRYETLSRKSPLELNNQNDIYKAVEMILFKFSMEIGYMKLVKNEKCFIDHTHWKKFVEIRKESMEYIDCFIGWRNEEDAFKLVRSISEEIYDYIRSYYIDKNTKI